MDESIVVKTSHDLIKQCFNKNIAIDATCGNGYDTLFLASLFNKVYAFDIQSLAIKRTKEKTNLLSNIELIQDDFNNINKHVFNLVDCIIFNLGFLPGSDKKTKTQDYNSDNAIIKAYQLLNHNGLLLVCCYLQHLGGKDEFNKIIDKLNHLNIIYKSSFYNDDKEAIIYIKKD